MFLCSLLCTYAFAPTALPRADKDITFTGHAAPLYRLLPELSDIAGVKLIASPQMADTVMIVKVDKVPLSDVMKRIADASTSEWEKTDEGYKLNLSISKANQEQQAEANDYVQGIENEINASLAALAERNKDYRMMAVPANFVKAIGSKCIAELGSGSRITFSTSPNRFQRLLPPSASTLVSGFIRAYEKSVPEIDDTTMFYLTLRRPKFTDGMIVGLSMCGSRLSPSVNIPQIYSGKRSQAAANNLEQPRNDFKLSETDQLFATTITTRAGKPGTCILCNDFFPGSSDHDIQYKPYDQEAYARIVSCDKIEPLSIFTGAALEWLAEDKNLIATIPDSAFVQSARFFSSWQGATPKLLDAMGNKWGLNYSQSSQWLTVTPARPVLARAYRINRKAFAAALRKASAQGIMGLDDQATFAMAQPSTPVDGNFQFAYLRMVSPKLGLTWVTNNYGNGYDALRLYGSLSPLQKSLARNAGLPVASLMASQMAQVQRLYFTNMSGGVLLTIDGAGKESVPRVSNGSPDQDPTNAQLDTWNESLRLFLIEQQDPAAVCGIDELGRIDVIGTPAGYSISRTDVDMPVVVSGLPRTYKKYVLGSRTEVRLTVGGNEHHRQFLFYDDKVNPNAPVLAFRELPKEFLEAFERTSRQVEEALKGFMDPPNIKP